MIGDADYYDDLSYSDWSLIMIDNDGWRWLIMIDDNDKSFMMINNDWRGMVMISIIRWYLLMMTDDDWQWLVMIGND